MVAIITGGGTGLEKSSAKILGADGMLGSASLGAASNQVFVNAANGNLVITRADEFLVGRGPNVEIDQTYNSQGDLSDDNGDNWRPSLYRQVTGLTGTVNTAGSTVKLVDWDGSVQSYTYDPTTLYYGSTDGSGAYDRLTYSGTTWTWKDGSGLLRGQFDSTNNGRAINLNDANLNLLTLSYTGNLITRVTSADGDYTNLVYSGTQLVQLDTFAPGSGSTPTLTRTYYTYDTSGRLYTVVTDLTPEDHDKTDGKVYTTTYTYDGTSKRVASIAQSDGSLVSFIYTLVGSDYRVSSLTQAVASGVSRTTQFAYDTTARRTTITDPLLQKTILSYDVNGNLTQIVAPPANASTASQIRQFTYDSTGNVTSVDEGDGNVVTYAYDSYGNWISRRDSLGNTTERTYLSGISLLQAETHYIVPAGSGAPTTPQTTRYVYTSSTRNLSYSVSAEGTVTAYTYDAAGKQLSAIEYVGSKYDTSALTTTQAPTETDLSNWIGTIDRSAARRTENTYDARENLNTTTSYSKLLSTGLFDTSSELTRTTYTYNQAGQLLNRQTVVGGVTKTETYTYDGLGRTKSTSDYNSISTTVLFADSSQTTTVTLANGSTEISVYDLAGELISFTKTGSGVTSQTTTYKYDALGRVKLTKDALGNYTYFFYDGAGRKIADIAASGSITEYRYDAENSVTSTTRYSTRLTPTQLGTLVDGSGNPTSITFDSLRPTTPTNDDRWTFNIYDLSERLVQTIDGTGATTVYTYDGASQLVSTTQYAGLVSPANIAALKASETANLFPGNPSSWTIFGASQTGSAIEGASAYKFTQTATGAAGGFQIYAPMASAGQVSTFQITLMGYNTTTSALLDLYGPNSGWGDTTNTKATILSGPGSLTNGTGGSVNITGLSTSVGTTIEITRVYTVTDSQVQPVVYINGTTATAGSAIIVAAPVLNARLHSPTYLPLGDPNDRVTRMFYDKDGNLIGTLDAEGYLTQNIYDAGGLKTQSIAYATQANTAYWASGTFAQLLPSTNANDIHHWMLYDARGLMAASIDGEGNLTRYTYTAQGDLGQVVTGQQLNPTTLISTPPTLATLPSAPTGTVLDTTLYTRDAYGHVLTETRTLTTTPSSVTTVTNYSYDSFYNVTSKTTQYGSSDPHIFNQRYDAFGRLTGALNAEGNTQLVALGGSPTQAAIDGVYTTYGTTYTYDTDNNLIATTEGRGLGVSVANTLNYYNADGTLAYAISPLGEVTKYSYNAFGQRTDTTVYATRISTAGLTGGVITSGLTNAITTSASDATTHVDYNVDGTVKDRVDALSQTTNYYYDAFGDLTSETDPLEGATTVLASKTYDRRGLLKTSVVDPGASPHVAATTTDRYDAFGRLVGTLNGIGSAALAALGTNPTQQQIDNIYATQGTTYTFDRAGRVKTMVDALGNTTTYSYDGRGNLAAVQDALNNVTRYVYDNAERLIYTVDALGDVTQNTYDDEGRVIQTQAYATPISLNNLATVASVSDISGRVSASSGKDEITHSVYDRDGKVRYSFDAGNYVTEFVYDTAGNAIRSIAYKAALIPSAYTVSAISSALGTPPSDARITRNIYNADHQLSYTIDALGYVTAYTYDTQGNVIKHLQVFANYVTVTADMGNPTDAAMANFVAGNPNATYDRITRAIYDQNGQLCFDIDAENYVTQYSYNKAGSVRFITRYGDQFDGTGGHTAFGDTTTLAQAITYVAATQVNPAATTEYQYDAAGRMYKTIDPANVVTLLTLDKLGRATTTEVAWQTSDSSITNQTYDVLGRLVSTTRAVGKAEATTTSYRYDALGRVTDTLEGNGNAAIAALVGTPTQAQIDAVWTAYATHYTYDANGNVQSKRVALDATLGTTATTTYGYDAFGNQVTLVDPLLNTGYFYYDLRNQLSRQIDPEGYETKTTYTFTGKVETVTRYFNHATWTGTPSATTPPNITASNAQDAVTTFTYDKLDRVLTSQDAEQFSDIYTYNAFGERDTVTNKLGGKTTNDYDRRGLLKSETLNTNGVINRYTYDARGNRKTMVEASGLAEARSTSYDYDLRDRLVDKKVTVAVSNATYNGNTDTVVTEYYQYDKRGNLIQTTDANNSKSFFFYDALDRKTAEISPVNILTNYKLDAAGNTIETRVYGTAVTPPATPGGTPPTGGTDYRKTTFNYDANNRLTSTVVAQVQYGERVGGTYTVATADNITRTVYDAAGNVVVQIDARGNSIYTYYNKLGQKTAQVDAENYLTTYTLDQNGNVTRETRYAIRVSGVVQGTPPAAPALTDARITDFGYDRNGRRTSETRLNVASATISGTTLTPTTVSAKIAYTYNGLGKVLTKTDLNPDGSTLDYIHYQYDNLGRETHHEQKAYLDYRGTSVTPATDTYYNGLNLVDHTIDRGDGTATAGDRTTTYTYGAGGRLTRTTDAANFATDYFYNAGGQLIAQTYTRVKSDNTTEIDGTVITYDAAGRETSHKTGIFSNSAWTFGDTTDQYYDGYGEVVARGTNTGGNKANAQEFADYDVMGRVWRTNSSDGVTKAYVFDANGNATLLLQATGTADLRTLTLDQMMAALPGGTVTATQSVFDKRNQLTETIQPSIANAAQLAGAIHAVDAVNATGPNFTGGAIAVGSTRSAAEVAGAVSGYPGGVAVTGAGSFSVHSIPMAWSGSTVTNYRTQSTLVLGPQYGGGTIYVTDSSGTVSYYSGPPQPTITFSEGNISGSTRRTYYAYQDVPGGGRVLIATSIRVDVISPSDYDSTVATQATLQIQGQDPRTTTVKMLVRAHGSSDPYQVVDTSQLMNVGGTAVSGWFTVNPNAAPFYGLAANASFDVLYYAMDASGNTLNAEATTLTVNASGVASFSAQTAVPINGPGQVAATWDTTNYTLLFSDFSASAQSVKVFYRAVGSGAAFAELAVNTTARGGAYGVSGWWSGRPPATGGPYEMWVESFSGLNGTGTMLSKSYGTFTGGAQPSTLTAYADQPETVHIANQPIATSMLLWYKPAGTSTWIQAANPVWNSAVGSWDWDAAGIAPNRLSNYQYDFRYETYNGAVMVNQAHGQVQLGHDPAALSDIMDQFTSTRSLQWVLFGSPDAAAVTDRQQTYDAFGEISSETDAFGHVTSMAYNTMGKLVLKQSAQVNSTDEHGVVTSVTPTERYYYDTTGHLIGVEDANGKRNLLSLLASGALGPGQDAITLAETHADGTTKSYGVDIFGNVRTITDEGSFITTNSYDKMGRLIQVIHPTRVGGNSPSLSLTDHYEYDGLGERLKHWNSYLTSSVAETTDYDQTGRVSQTRDFAGNIANYHYNWSTTLANTGLGTVGGVVKTIDIGGHTTTEKGDSSSESDDYFGHIVAKTDLGFNTFTYSYDKAGHLLHQSGSTGENIDYAYYGNGYIRSVTDNSLKMLSTFEYDKEGNRTLESYSTTDIGVSRIYYQVAHIDYDERNRVKTFADAKAVISYQYDAAGNRRNVHSVYQDGVNGVTQTQDYWYTYDSMNRFLISMGQLTAIGGNIQVGTTGVQVSYLGGRRMTALNGADGTQEAYTYTSDGYLENTTINGVLRAKRVNDELGRVKTYTEYSATGALSFSQDSTYDGDNRVTDQVVTQIQTDSTYKYTNFHNDYRADVGGGSYTGADRGTIIHTRQQDQGSSVVQDTLYTYAWWDEAKQVGIQVNGTDPNNPNAYQWAPGASQLSYDVNGHLSGAVVTGGAFNTITYSNDAYGQVMMRESKVGNAVGPRQLYYYFDGHRIGDVGNNGPSRVDYAVALARRGTPDQPGTFRGGQRVASADFDENYEPIGADNSGMAASSYTVRSGDTLQSIAQTTWGDASLWYLIADANGLTASSSLVAGQTLSIPNKVANFHNTSETYRVYNPGEAIGDNMPLLPTAPAPPAKSKCGVLGMIILAVIAIAVVVATHGALVHEMGQILGSAVGGAMGSLFSQVVGVATGIQDEFSFKGVALAALGGAVGGGLQNFNALGTATKLATFGSDVVRGALGSAITQGIAVATHLQDKFDWVGVAAAGIGSGLGNAFARDVLHVDPAATPHNLAGYIAQTATGTVSALANAGTRSLLEGSDFGDNLIAALPDVIASTIGSMIGNAINKKDGGSVINYEPDAPDPLSHMDGLNLPTISDMSPSPSATGGVSPESPRIDLNVDGLYGDKPAYHPEAAYYHYDPNDIVVTAKPGRGSSDMIGPFRVGSGPLAMTLTQALLNPRTTPSQRTQLIVGFESGRFGGGNRGDGIVARVVKQNLLSEIDGGKSPKDILGEVYNISKYTADASNGKNVDLLANSLAELNDVVSQVRQLVVGMSESLQDAPETDAVLTMGIGELGSATEGAGSAARSLAEGALEGGGNLLRGLAANSFRRIFTGSRLAEEEVVGSEVGQAARLPRNGSRTVLNQGNAPTCGPTSVCMVLDTTGLQADLGSVIARAQVGANGISMTRVASLLREGGANAAFKQGMTVDDLAVATAKGNPAVVAVRTTGGGHAIVVDGITVRQGVRVVAVRDPHGIQYFESVAAFNKRFLGQGVIVK